MNRLTVLETERRLMAAMMCDPGLIPALSDIIAPRDFADSRAGAVFHAGLQLARDGQSADATAIIYYLERIGTLGAVGQDYILGAQSDGFTSVLAPGQAKAVAGAARLRRFQSELIDTTAKLQDADPLNADGAIAACIETVMAHATMAEDASRVGLDAAVRMFTDIALANAKTRQDGGIVRAGLATPLRAINTPTVGGFRPGELYAIGARPKTGKTALAFGLGAGVAAMAKGHTLYLSWEDQPIWLGGRVASNVLKAQGMKLYGGDMSQDDVQRLVALRNRAEGRNGGPTMGDMLTIVHKPGAGVELVEAEVVRYLRSPAQARFPLAFVVVDHAGRLIDDSARSGTDNELRRVVKQCETTAKRHGVATLILSQLRRLQGGGGKTRPPTVEDFRGSDALLECCSMLMLLHRPQAVDPEYPRADEAYLIVPANRLGSTGKWSLHFDVRSGTYTDADAPWPDASTRGSRWEGA